MVWRYVEFNLIQHTNIKIKTNLEKCDGVFEIGEFTIRSELSKPLNQFRRKLIENLRDFHQ